MRNLFLSRCIHSSAAISAKKSPLALLRKKTGYSISNCKKALEANENDVEKAETWLHVKAQEQGWAKATKLQDRSTAQGLIGIALNKSHTAAAMIELNCETDFVSRNSKFQELVSSVTDYCLLEVEKKQADGRRFIPLSEEELKSMCMPEGGSLADLIALNIGRIGENMKLRRAIGAVAEPSTHLSCYAHPSSGGFCPSKMIGRFGAVAVLKRHSEEPMPNNLTIDTLGRQICQHIVGMNPTSLARKEDEPLLPPAEATALLDQEFLVDPDLTVKEVLDACGVSVLDFMRFECGGN